MFMLCESILVKKTKNQIQWFIYEEKEIFLVISLAILVYANKHLHYICNKFVMIFSKEK